MHDVERALFDLRQGRALHVSAPDAAGALIATVDGLVSPTLEQLRLGGPVRLAVTPHRARAMGLLADPRGDHVPRGLSLALNGEGPDQILRLSSARGTFSTETLDPRAATAPEIGGLTLARLGRLLPAVVCAPADRARVPALSHALDSGAILAVTAAAIDAMAANIELRVTHVSNGPVPLRDAEDARFMYFRESNGLLEHVAILIGHQQQWPDPVPVRIHSACLTGDLFGSLRCDCGEQLRESLRLFATGGGGVLLYMAQEGRDIGLGNKLRAYALQQEGLDTIDADGTLGFGADERRYHAAVAMLTTLEIERVRLLTNNPDKVRAVREGGIQVVERQPLYGTLNRHNLPYVKAKVHRAGHWLTDMLSGAVPSD